jgi:Spy/CpxP family protein refolding chaperone
MAKITTQHDEEVVAAGRKIRQAQRGLDEAIMNPLYNEAEINRRIEDLAQARADQVRLQQRMRAEIRKVLTPEQVMKFNEVQREMQKKMQEQRQIQMQQTSPDRSPSGDQSRTSQQPSLDMIDIFLAKGK